MKKRFSEEQIIGFLREAERGVAVKDLCRRHGFSEASYYLWRSKFGGMGSGNWRNHSGIRRTEQHAYRPNRNAHSAIRQVHGLLYEGYTEIVDADLSSYFDSIPHAELMKSVARRIVDRHVLHLIKMWLDAPTEENDGRGGAKRSTRNRDEERGIPQGSPLSPLLSNLYMRRFILGWKRRGLERRLRARIVNYADDLVICCRGSGAEALQSMRRMMSQLKLTVSQEKTRLCRISADTFDFLGYTFGRYFSPVTGRAYLGSRPSKKSVRRVVRAVTEATARNTTLLTADMLVEQLNALLRGWANYFCRVQ